MKLRKFYNRFKLFIVLPLIALMLLSTCLTSSVLAMPVPGGNGTHDSVLATPSIVKATALNMPSIGLNGLLTQLNFTVDSLNQACNQMFAGGRFITAYASDGKTSYARNGVFSFNETTGVVSTSFKPTLAGPSVEVYSVLPTTDCKSVYIGGAFTSVDGVGKGYLVKYDLLKNALDPTFNARVNGQVNSLVLWNGQLLVGGDFTAAGGVSETALAALDPVTGTNTGYFTRLVVSGTQPSATAGVTRVKTIAISPTATLEANTGQTVQHLVMAGNWSAVGGYSRGQVAMISLCATPALTSWDSTMLHDLADPRFGNYLRGISFLPDGSAFFLAASGGYGGMVNGPNDALTRFEMKVTGHLVVPTWINKTGGDSLWTVVATPKAIYVAGHERWANNPQGHDSAGPGALSRPGIGAIDPTTGTALSWNPNRSRYVGGEALLITPAGLWVGSDGPNLGCAAPAGANHDDCTGQALQSHPGIGFLPY